MWVGIAIAVAVLVVGWEFIAIWMPWLSGMKGVETGRKDEAARLFERALAARSLFSGFIQQDVRYRLAWLRMDAGRYDDAIAILGESLNGRLKPDVEANHRERLSEALDGAGRTEEAETERRRVLELLSASGETADALLVRAKTLNRRHAYAEEYAVLQNALLKIPSSNSDLRAQTMLHLGLAAFNSSMAAETVYWSEQALAIAEAGPSKHMTGHSVCALGMLHLGRLDEAEEHRRKALELAKSIGSTDQAARYLAQLADVVRRRGNIAEALRMCEEARAMTVSERRHVYAVENSCLCEKGQFEQALELFGPIRRGKMNAAPSAERRMQLNYDGFEANVLLELGRAEEALQRNTSALEGLKDDAKLSFQFQADRAWILAALGRREEALTQASHVELRMPEVATSRGNQVTGLYSLGRAYVAMSDWERARGAWKRYLDIQPDPVDEPRGHYFLAKALSGLGRAEEAREELRRASQGPGEVYLARAAARELAAAGE